MMTALSRLRASGLAALRPLHLLANRLLQMRLKHSRDYLGTYAVLEHYPDTDAARDLLSRMADRAQRDPAYARMFCYWLKHGSTLRFRELAAPFGDYLQDRALRDLVNFIDSAHYYRTEDMDVHTEPRTTG